MLLPVVFVACSKHQIPTLIPTDDFIQTSKMQRGNVKVREGGGGFWQGGSWKFGTSECRGAKTQQNLGTWETTRLEGEQQIRERDTGEVTANNLKQVCRSEGGRQVPQGTSSGERENCTDKAPGKHQTWRNRCDELNWSKVQLHPARRNLSREPAATREPAGLTNLHWFQWKHQLFPAKMAD